MMSPLKPIEFLIALMVMSLIRLAIGVIPMTLLAMIFFDFKSLRASRIPLIAFFCNLIFTAGQWNFRLGLVLRHGLGAESIVWTLMFGPDATGLHLLSGDRTAGLASILAWALPRLTSSRGCGRC